MRPLSEALKSLPAETVPAGNVGVLKSELKTVPAPVALKTIEPSVVEQLYGLLNATVALGAA
jgi:hypothetical protein